MMSLIAAVFRLARRVVDRQLEIDRLRKELAAEQALSRRLGEALAEQTARAGEAFGARRRASA